MWGTRLQVTASMRPIAKSPPSGFPFVAAIDGRLIFSLLVAHA
jgi:hypothetical protein